MNAGTAGKRGDIARGFTIMELLIAMAIVAILAAVALPNYTNYVQRGKIAEATANLATMRVLMEQYFLDNRSYVDGPCTSPGASTYFTYACTPAATATAYTMVATGVAGQGMAGFAYSIDQANNRRTTAFPGAAGLPATCWMTSKAGC